MANVKNSYETVMVFDIRSGEDGIKALIERFKGIIAENGDIDSEEDWGKRRLAYPIRDELEGYYYKVNFTSGHDFPAELDRVYKITDGVLRTLIVRAEPEKEDPKKNAEPAQPESQSNEAQPEAVAPDAPKAVVSDMPQAPAEPEAGKSQGE